MPSLEVPQRLSTDDFVTIHGQISGTFKQPPLDGSLNLPMSTLPWLQTSSYTSFYLHLLTLITHVLVVEWHAEHSPQHTWAVYPKTDKTLQHITWKHLAHAIQKYVI